MIYSHRLGFFADLSSRRSRNLCAVACADNRTCGRPRPAGIFLRTANNRQRRLAARVFRLSLWPIPPRQLAALRREDHQVLTARCQVSSPPRSGFQLASSASYCSRFRWNGDVLSLGLASCSVCPSSAGGIIKQEQKLGG